MWPKPSTAPRTSPSPGTPTAVAAAVRRWADAGADTVVLHRPATEPDLEGFVRFLGRQVRPLVG